MIRDTMKQVGGSILIELDRSAPANAEFVAKLRLAGVPVPLILVAARNGVLVAGVLAAQATRGAWWRWFPRRSRRRSCRLSRAASPSSSP